MTRLLSIPQRAPRLCLVIIMALTAFFGYFAQSIRVDSSMENLLPEHDRERQYYEKIRGEFGSEEVMVIGVFAEDVFAPATLAKLERLTKRLTEVEDVREVLSLTNIEGIELGDFGLNIGALMRERPRTAAESDLFRARVMRNPIYLKNIVSADSRATAISIIFEPMGEQAFIERDLDGRIRGIVEAFRGPEEFAITGLPTMKVYGSRYMRDDVIRFTPLAALVVVVVLAWAFHTFRGVLIPLCTVLVGVVWTTGLMVITSSPINMGTLVLAPLLMAIGVAYSIHMMSQYYQHLRPDRSQDEAIAAMMEHVRVPVGIAALTTLIGFATFLLTPIPAIREFGLYSVFGIVAVLIASFTIVPAVLTLLPPPHRGLGHHHEDSRMTRLLGLLGGISVRHRNVVLALGAVVCVVSGWGITRLTVETDYLGFFRPSDPIRADNERIARHLAGTQPIYVVVDGGKPKSATRLEVLEAISKLEEFALSHAHVDTTLSLVDYLRVVREALDPEAPPLPQNQSEIEQLLLLVDAKQLAPVLNRDMSRTNIIVRTHLSKSREVGDFVEDIRAFAATVFPKGVAVRPTGSVVLLNRSADTLAWGQITGLWQVFAVLLVLMCLLFLSLRVGFLSLVPNAVPILILFGIMGWSGISLNISTSLIAAIAIGIAVDDTIHYLTAFNAGLRISGDQGEAVMYAARSVGRAIIFTSVALAAGFLVVSLSNFQPVRHFGYLASATMVIALLSDLILTPAILMTTNVVTLWELLFLKLGPEPHKEIPLFAGLRPFQAKIVVLMARLASGSPGTPLTRRGEMKEELYVLLTGRADVQRGDGGQVIRVLGRGDVIGEMGLVRKQARSANVTIVDEAEYLVLDGGFLNRLPRLYPRIASTVFLNLTRILSDRLETTTDQLSAAKTPPAAGLAR